MNENNEPVNTGSQESTAGDTAAQAPQILDLDGASSWKFQGNTYTPDQFLDLVQRSEKYGETSEYVTKDKDYWSNVFHDIDRVIKNPSRADEFKQIYPERFHAILDRHLNGNKRSEEVQGNQGQLPKEVQEKIQAMEDRLSFYENRTRQADIEAESAKIDSILPKLLDKYPLADEDKVLLAAEKFLSRGGKGAKLTEAVWDRLVREDHERTTSRADKVYQAKLKEQINKGKAGADTGAGGSTPGQAPLKPKTFKEAQEMMIASLKGKGLS